MRLHVLQVATIAVVAVMASGCATRPVWLPTANATLTPDRVTAKCNFEVEKAAPGLSSRETALTQAFIRNDIFSACMRAEGYELGYQNPDVK